MIRKTLVCDVCGHDIKKYPVSGSKMTIKHGDYFRGELIIKESSYDDICQVCSNQIQEYLLSKREATQ